MKVFLLKLYYLKLELGGRYCFTGFVVKGKEKIIFNHSDVIK